MLALEDTELYEFSTQHFNFGIRSVVQKTKHITEILIVYISQFMWLGELPKSHTPRFLLETIHLY
jgi:hypothetical protein